MKRGKGVSPVIATVLLIGMVVASALIVFLWFKGFTKETITKFGGENIELACKNIVLDVDYSSGTLSVSNTGNVPVYDLNLKISSGIEFTTKSIKQISSEWPAVGLKQGQAFSGDIENEVGSANSMIIIPILIGTTQSGDERTFVCDEQYGYQISI